MHTDTFQSSLVTVESTVWASERATLGQRNANASVPCSRACSSHEGKRESDKRGFAEHDGTGGRAGSVRAVTVTASRSEGGRRREPVGKSSSKLTFLYTLEASCSIMMLHMLVYSNHIDEELCALPRLLA